MAFGTRGEKKSQNENLGEAALADTNSPSSSSSSSSHPFGFVRRPHVYLVYLMRMFGSAFTREVGNRDNKYISL